MTKYKCGHEVKELFVTKDFSFSHYFLWRDTKGFDGDKTLCFSCWLKRLKDGNK